MNGRLRRWGWAAWLGLLALALNALVPAHLAFDLAEALGTARHGAHAVAHSAEWRLLALLLGHREGDGKAPAKTPRHDQDHRAACPAFSAVGTLAGFVPPAPVSLSLPVAIAIATVLPPTERELSAAPVTAYRSRAPPIA